MSNSGYSILYSGGQKSDAYTLCNYIDEFYHAAGVEHCDIDLGKIIAVVQTSYLEFPSPLGVDKSSPFKKVAAFTAHQESWFLG